MIFGSDAVTIPFASFFNMVVKSSMGREMIILMLWNNFDFERLRESEYGSTL